MSSFVDLMGRAVWSEEDIVRRTEAMLRGEFSLEQELILNRKLKGVENGVYVLTPGEAQELAAFQAASFRAQTEGFYARYDMARLRLALDVEEAERRLALPQVESVEDPAYAQDVAERNAATAVISAATADTLLLVEERRAAP